VNILASPLVLQSFGDRQSPDKSMSEIVMSVSQVRRDMGRAVVGILMYGGEAEGTITAGDTITTKSLKGPPANAETSCVSQVQTIPPSQSRRDY
jgi:hypothetical protein